VFLNKVWIKSAAVLPIDRLVRESRTRSFHFLDHSGCGNPGESLTYGEILNAINMGRADDIKQRLPTKQPWK
jgi:hypothetical protein